MSKEWEITEVVTVIRKVEVKADSYDEAKEIYDDQYSSCPDHYLDWYVDEEYVDDYDIEEIE